MPEYPDVQLYLHALGPRVVGATLQRIVARGPNLLRSVDPPPRALEGLRVAGLERIGKRIVLCFECELFAVLHLMIAGRLQWTALDRKPNRRLAQGWFDFDRGRLVLTEASGKKRAALVLVRGRAELQRQDPGGLEVTTCDLEPFSRGLTRGNHTLKRALTDPRLFSGIGNAYSDEILHRARLSPFARTGQLQPEAVARLHAATRDVLLEWEQRLVRATGDGWPRKVTAFREGMAAHGRYGEPCPVCGVAIQRIVYASNETNYCPGCQTGGKILADRSLSRLLREDWPRSLEELEERTRSSGED